MAWHSRGARRSPLLKLPSPKQESSRARLERPLFLGAGAPPGVLLHQRLPGRKGGVGGLVVDILVLLPLLVFHIAKLELFAIGLQASAEWGRVCETTRVQAVPEAWSLAWCYWSEAGQVVHLRGKCCLILFLSWGLGCRWAGQAPWTASTVLKGIVKGEGCD
jgi:hypothetical protein